MFFTGQNVLMWAPALALAVVLRAITHRLKHQLIFPMCKCDSDSRLPRSQTCLGILDFLMVPVVFYIVVAAAHIDLGVLREKGWLFDMGTSREPWYHFYSLYGRRAASFGFMS